MKLIGIEELFLTPEIRQAWNAIGHVQHRVLIRGPTFSQA